MPTPTVDASAFAFASLVVIPEGNLLLLLSLRLPLPVPSRHPERNEGPLYFLPRHSIPTAILLLCLTPTQAQQMPGMTMPPTQSTLPPLTPTTNLLPPQNPTPLILDSLLTRAYAASPTLAQTRAATTRTQAQARQAALYPNPTIGYQGDQIRGGSFGGGEQGAYLAQTIPLGGKLTIRRKALEAEAEATRLSTEVQQTRIRADVTQAFYAAAAAQQTAKIRRDLLKNAQDATQTAYQLANVGQADAPDILSTEVEQEQAELADEQAQRLFLARFRTLAILTGDPSLPLAPLEADLAATPSPTLANLLDDNPLIHQAQAQIAAVEARLASARREVAPDLQLKAGEQYNFEQLGSAPGNPSLTTKVGPQTFASAALTLPLWNRNQGNIAAAEADLTAAHENLRRVQLTLRAQAEPLLATLATAQSQATRYRTSILPRATRAANLYQQKYDQMAQAYPQVLIARRTLLDLQLQYTQTLATLWRAATALQTLNLTGAFDPITQPEAVTPSTPPPSD